MIRNADTAMYTAKDGGRNRVAVFNETIAAKAIARLDIEHALGGAIERSEFALHYQPEVMLDGGTVTGVEALVRWHHEGRGLVSPDEFIPVAEEIGAITLLGEWVLRESVRQLGEWTRELDPSEPFTMWVNVSVVQLMQPDFVPMVRRCMEEGRVAPGRLGLEITESVIMADAELAESSISALRGLGVRIAIDDFGTGYSSLAYLRQLHVDVVKIDQSFVNDLDSIDGSSCLVQAIINMAHAVGCDVIAEGVETASQYRALVGMGCDMAQGYGLAEPSLPSATIPTISTRWM